MRGQEIDILYCTARKFEAMKFWQTSYRSMATENLVEKNTLILLTHDTP